MRNLVVLVLLSCIACSADKARSPEQKPGELAVKPTSPGHGTVLSPTFDFVMVDTRSDFAHDYGNQVSIQAVSVAGAPCPKAEMMSCVVKHWSGWTSDGKRDDAAVIATATQFVKAWDGLHELGRLTEPQAPAKLARVIGYVSGRRGPSDTFAYHAPRTEIFEVKGERVVVVTRFIRAQISQRGQHWNYAVSAFRIKDGTSYNVYGVDALPQPVSLSEAM